MTRWWNKTLSSIIIYLILEVTQTFELWFEFVYKAGLVLSSLILWKPEGLGAKGDEQDQAEYALKGFRGHHILAFFKMSCL